MTNNDSSTPETERNKLTVLRFMELMDARDFDALGEVLAPDLQLRLGGSVLDRQETEAMIRTVYDAFPDWTHTVEEVLAADDRVVLRATDRATHRSVFQGITPTGRQIIVGQIGIYRMVNGLIAEIWEQFDMFGLMQQLGSARSSVACGSSPPPIDSAVEEAAIRKLTAGWFADEIRRNMEASLSYLAPDAVVQAGGSPTLVGIHAMRSLYEEFFKIPYTDVVMEERTVVVASSGDLAYDIGPWKLVFEGPEGVTESPGKSTIIWRKFDGQWKCVVMSFSMDAPGAASTD